MFAYCNNNPISFQDSSGNFGVPAFQQTREGFFRGGGAVGGGATIGGAGLLELLVATTVAVISTAVAVFTSSSAKDEEIAITAAVNQEPSDVTIYRYHASKDENLAPRKGIDYNGLSFKTIPPRNGVKAVATTINTINATGELFAFQTSATHVLVIPLGGTVLEWMNLGMNSHWSRILAAIVVETSEGENDKHEPNY